MLIDSKLKEHKFIVIGEEHYTPLGAIRSLGEIGINPIFIVIKNKNKRMPKVASKSKYISKLFSIDSYNEVKDILLCVVYCLVSICRNVYS